MQIPIQRLLTVAGLYAVVAVCLPIDTAHAKPTMWDEPAAGARPAARQDAPPHPELMRFLLQRVEDPQLLRGYRVAILASDGVDGFELFITERFLADRGALVHLVVPRSAGAGYSRAAVARISVLNPSGEEDEAVADRFLDQVQAREYDAIFVPSNRTQSRRLEQASTTRFLQQSLNQETQVYASGNGARVLLQAGLLDRRGVIAHVAAGEQLDVSAADVAGAAVAVDSRIYTTRDAFGMPDLIERLIEDLLRRPPRAD